MYIIWYFISKGRHCPDGVSCLVKGIPLNKTPVPTGKKEKN